MTQEEKARSYDEALERARKMMDSKRSVVICKQALETIFPQLRDSDDEKIRKWLVDYFKAVGESWIHRDISPEQIVAYLEKQKEQKPVEWSEEDERNINTLISVIEAHYNEYDLVRDDYPINARELGDWLKSLRPYWRPSEEQIYSLGTVVKGAGESSVGSIGYNLKELYEQLKKLM